jgi:cytochrome c oxidase assembly protein subunit 15
VSSRRAFQTAYRLALSTTLLMFGLMVIGSVVRTTGAGLACPDWPLCQGRLIPPLRFDVLIEWFHRLVALLVSLLLFATAGWILTHRELRARLGGLALLGIVLLAAQVLLGALTVWKLLDPNVVAGHLGVALLLFSTLLVLTLVARGEAEPEPVRPTRPAGLLPVFGVAALLTYGQALLGGMVSANGAGLACPDWPTCNGEWFPSLHGPVGLQMTHRYGAYALGAMMLFTAMRARLALDGGARRAGLAALALTVVQVMLGVANVLLGVPWWLSAAHLATAVTILALLITAAYRTAILPASERALAVAVPT